MINRSISTHARIASLLIITILIIFFARALDVLQKTERTTYYILYLIPSISHSTHQ